MHKQLTPEKIREIFEYEPETGHLRWKIKPSQGTKVGDIAGCLHSSGYLLAGVCGKKYKIHRLIFAWVYGRWPTNEIDHINGVRADNRIKNLRDITSRENRKNQRLRHDNTSGYVGVSWYKNYNKWEAKICVDSKQIRLGYFIALPDAIEARKDASAKYGFHKNHGSVLADKNHVR